VRIRDKVEAVVSVSFYYMQCDMIYFCRHYGGLTGLNKAETAAKHGEEQVRGTDLGLVRLVYCAVSPVLRIRDVLSRIRIRPLLHPGSGSRIRGGKKAPDPGSGIKASRIRGVKKHRRIRIRNTGSATYSMVVD
jgi:hypothetical protein